MNIDKKVFIKSSLLLIFVESIIVLIIFWRLYPYPYPDDMWSEIATIQYFKQRFLSLPLNSKPVNLYSFPGYYMLLAFLSIIFNFSSYNFYLMSEFLLIAISIPVFLLSFTFLSKSQKYGIILTIIFLSIPAAGDMTTIYFNIPQNFVLALFFIFFLLNMYERNSEILDKPCKNNYLSRLLNSSIFFVLIGILITFYAFISHVTSIFLFLFLYPSFGEIGFESIEYNNFLLKFFGFFLGFLIIVFKIPFFEIIWGNIKFEQITIYSFFLKNIFKLDANITFLLIFFSGLIWNSIFWMIFNKKIRIKESIFILVNFSSIVLFLIFCILTIFISKLRFYVMKSYFFVMFPNIISIIKLGTVIILPLIIILKLLFQIKYEKNNTSFDILKSKILIYLRKDIDPFFVVFLLFSAIVVQTAGEFNDRFIYFLIMILIFSFRSFKPFSNIYSFKFKNHIFSEKRIIKMFYLMLIFMLIISIFAQFHLTETLPWPKESAQPMINYIKNNDINPKYILTIDPVVHDLFYSFGLYVIFQPVNALTKTNFIKILNQSKCLYFLANWDNKTSTYKDLSNKTIFLLNGMNPVFEYNGSFKLFDIHAIEKSI